MSSESGADITPEQAADIIGIRSQQARWMRLVGRGA
jgi:hypothetical protein